ncbi:MAG: serine hydrolase domain-containing protein [Pseudohongiellaceae bacterium]|nr:serine hydrolase domain-containing protein [Pseudohongiellaceae bacterium]
MISKKLPAKICVVITALFVSSFCYPQDGSGSSASPWQASLDDRLASAREDADVVGMGAVIMRNGKVLATSVNGRKSSDSDSPLNVSDKWHLGSISKSMTATMLARLVEKDILDWDLTLGEAFPEESSDIHRKWRRVTLEQLLTHTSGAQRDLSMLASLYSPDEGVELMQEREKQVLKILSKAPESEPGSQYRYSNIGYAIAGTVAEKLTGSSWESLMRTELYAPLGIASGGFGAPDQSDQNQPSGHKHFLGRTVKAGREDELSSVIGPAGSVHMNLNDLMVYANSHIEGFRGNSNIISAQNYKRLHTPIANNYAYGWNISSEISWSQSPIVWHAGSNGLWCAVLALLPDINSAIAVTANDCNDTDQTFDSIWQLIEQSVIALQQYPHVQ